MIREGKRCRNVVKVKDSRFSRKSIMECEALVMPPLIDNVNYQTKAIDTNNTEYAARDLEEPIEADVSTIKNSCAAKKFEVIAPKKSPRQIERFKFKRADSSPVMVLEKPTKNHTLNNALKNRENGMNHQWKKRGRTVSFDECVHVLTKCSVIEIPLKNSTHENSGCYCKCRKGILKRGEGASVKKRVTFKREDLVRSAILNHNLSEFEEVCKQLEINFNKKLSDGLTPLHLAGISGSYRIVQFILKHGGKIDETDDLGWTPLHHAVSHGHIPCALVLLQAGADINARTADYCTAIELATQDEMLLLLGRVMNGVLLRTSLDQNKETYV